MFNRMKAVVTFAAGAVAGLMLAACRYRVPAPAYSAARPLSCR